MCERWAAARADQSIINDFLDALVEKGVVLCKRVESEGNFSDYAPLGERDIEKLYMEYVRVDPKVLEDERRALVKHAQETAKR